MQSILIASGIFPPDIGGPGTFAMDLAMHAASQGFEVTVLTYSPVIRHRADSNLPFRVCRVWRGIPFGIRHGVYFLCAWLLARSGTTVLALNAVSAGLPSWAAARLRRRRFVVRIPGDAAWESAATRVLTPFLIDDFQKHHRPFRVRFLHWSQGFVCRHADAVVTLSQYFKGIVEGWGVPTERIHVIHNGIKHGEFGGSREDARKRTGINGIALLSVGRMVPWKGFRMLIKIMPALLRVNQGFRLHIVGDGPQMKELRSVVRNLHMERSVTLVGAKPHAELAAYYAAADMFVLNTGFESYSHQLLEAMDAGLPVITTTAGSNPEVIRQGENGIMVKFNDEFALQESILALWLQSTLRDELAAAGRATAHEHRAAPMAQAYLELLT